MLKKTVFCSLLTAALLLPSSGLTNAADMGGFKDTAGSFAEKSINTLYQQGIINGLSADRFGPGEKITRAHFAVLTAKALGIQPMLPQTPSFSDVAKASEGYGYVEAMVRLGLLQGSGNHRLAAGEPISRQDVAVILARVLKQNEASAAGKSIEPYKDAAQTAPYAQNAVRTLTEQGWMQGDKGLFRPQQLLTRAEAAVLAERMMEWSQQRQQDVGQDKIPQTLELKPLDQVKIPLPEAASGLPYTPVFGWDQPAIGRIAADGTFTANLPGQGTLTVNIGDQTYSIQIVIQASKPDDASFLN